MANKECLKILEEKLSLYIKTQINNLDENITTIKAEHAPKGLLKSGATIKRVKRLCIDMFEAREDLIINVIKDLPLEYENGLCKKLKHLAKSYFPEDLGEIGKRLQNIVTFIGNEKLQDSVINEAKENVKDIVMKVENQIDQYIIGLKKTLQISKFDKAIFLIEGVCLLTIAFLAGKWSMNPSDNYEPYIVIIGVSTPLFEIGRRLWKKHAT